MRKTSTGYVYADSSCDKNYFNLNYEKDKNSCIKFLEPLLQRHKYGASKQQCLRLRFYKV